MPDRISDVELKAIVNSEIRSAMGELTGELASDRAEAMDYYYGEPTGRLAQPNEDRSRVVITTVRDTVEWLMPQLMRMFAQPDKVVEFEAVGEEDEEAANQETMAINHIFWRQNEGFLILYTWFKDALLQKNGTVKYWIDETDERDREEYTGLPDMALAQMLSDPELEVVEIKPSDVQSIDGTPLNHVVFERKSTKKHIQVEVIPPEEFLISDDARSLDVQTDHPRFVGHRTEKTRSELKQMGFSDEAIDEMMKSGEDEQYDQEHVARYNYSDEQGVLTGGSYEPHESQRKAEFVEGYITLDRDGDGYAELLKVYAAGNYIEAEEADHIPFACLTPYINPHKHHGLSQHDMVKDLQEIASQIFRNVFDNMLQTNNMRPVVNENVDLDSLLVTRPGAPIYTESSGPVANDVAPFAPPPMWKEGLTLLEYIDQIRKDRTGIGDETMGLDPKVLANINTGVLLEAIEAARGKIELVARIFAETGIKWLFRGIHELARKNYDQELRYELSGKYVAVNPQEWKKRTSLTVNVGTASGSQQRELSKLMQIGEAQMGLVNSGGMGVTILPMHLYQTAKELAENLGAKDGDKYFLNPLMRMDPQMQQLIQMQIPPPQPDPQMQLVQATTQIEQGKLQAQSQKNQLDFAARQNELALKREEMEVRANLDAMKSQLTAIQAEAKNQTQQEKQRSEAEIKEIANMIKEMEVRLEDNQKSHQIMMDKYRADLQSYTTLQGKAMDVQQSGFEAAERAQQRALEARAQAEKEEREAEKLRESARQAEEQAKSEESRRKAEKDKVQKRIDDQEKTTKQTFELVAGLMDRLEKMSQDIGKPREIQRDAAGRPVSIGGRKISYNSDGTIRQIG